MFILAKIFFSNSSQDINLKQDEVDRIAALKTYLSHLKKEEMEKFKFPTGVSSDWIPLISTKASDITARSHLSERSNQTKQNGKQSNLLESSNLTPMTFASQDKTLEDAKKIAEIYRDNTNEIIEDKNPNDNLYNSSPGQDSSNFKKYLTCCDKLFNQYGTVDEKIYEDMYISPARYRFNPAPEAPIIPPQITSIVSPSSLPPSTSYYSYPLRQPPQTSSISPSPIQSYNLRPIVRDHIQTTVHLNTLPSSLTPNQKYDSQPECFADPHHFYHNHKRTPTRFISTENYHPFPYQPRSNHFRPTYIPRQGWFARKKHAIFGRKSTVYFG